MSPILTRMRLSSSRNPIHAGARWFWECIRISTKRGNGRLRNCSCQWDRAGLLGCCFGSCLVLGLARWRKRRWARHGHGPATKPIGTLHIALVEASDPFTRHLSPQCILLSFLHTIAVRMTKYDAPRVLRCRIRIPVSTSTPM